MPGPETVREHLGARPSTSEIAHVLGPALGGFLLFGSLFPSPFLGGLLGAALGILAGLARNHRLARAR